MEDSKEWMSALYVRHRGVWLSGTQLQAVASDSRVSTHPSSAASPATPTLPPSQPFQLLVLVLLVLGLWHVTAASACLHTAFPPVSHVLSPVSSHTSFPMHHARVISSLWQRRFRGGFLSDPQNTLLCPIHRKLTFFLVFWEHPRKVSTSKRFLGKIGENSIWLLFMAWWLKTWGFYLWQLLTLELAREVSCKLSHQEV